MSKRNWFFLPLNVCVCLRVLIAQSRPFDLFLIATHIWGTDKESWTKPNQWKAERGGQKEKERRGKRHTVYGGSFGVWCRQFDAVHFSCYFCCCCCCQHFCFDHRHQHHRCLIIAHSSNPVPKNSTIESLPPWFVTNRFLSLVLFIPQTEIERIEFRDTENSEYSEN